MFREAEQFIEKNEDGTVKQVHQVTDANGNIDYLKLVEAMLAEEDPLKIPEPKNR